jgi:hypothetical protein
MNVRLLYVCFTTPSKVFFNMSPNQRFIQKLTKKEEKE